MFALAEGSIPANSLKTQRCIRRGIENVVPTNLLVFLIFPLI